MSLFNANWIGFDGTPITGKVPTQMVVHADAGFQISEQQRGAVNHAYKLFCDAIKLSAFPDGYHVQNRELQDGTRVRMMSINSVHQVHVWPAGGNDRNLELPHGFVVSAPWGVPRFYRRDIRGASPMWVYDEKVKVPQAVKEISGDNQVFITDPKRAVVPLVHNGASHGLWDFAHHGALAAASPPAVPIALHIGDQKYSQHPAHYAIGRYILDKDGEALYTMGVHPMINDWDADNPVIGHAVSDIGGTVVALNTFRESSITITSDVYYMTFCNERVARTEAAVYTLQERNLVGLYPKVYSPLSATSGSAHYTTLAGDPPPWSDFFQKNFGNDNLSPGYIGGSSGLAGKYKTMDVPGEARKWGLIQEYVGGNNAYWGFTETAVNLAAYQSSSEAASRTEVNQSSGTPLTHNKVVVLPSVTQYAQLEYDIAYPYTYFWQAGQIRREAQKPGPGGGIEYGYGMSSKLVDRRDLYRLMDTTGAVKLKLGWTDVNLLEAVVYGKCEGRLHYTQEQKWVNLGPFSGNVCTAPCPPYDTPGYPLPDPYSVPLGTVREFFHDKQALYLATEKKSYLTALAADPANNSTTTTTTLNVASYVDGHYTYTSRHIIDYDHRAKFWAAIKIVVQCVGARWDQAAGFARGMCSVTTHPTYTVSIYFESNWNGVQALQLLTSASVTRQAYDFIYYSDGNPFDWREGHSVTNVQMPMPPVVAPESECLRQLANLTNHQGVSTHFAAQDQFTPDDPDSKSPTGIEYSRLVGDREIPHTKYATGMLYARTFKIGDFPDALWMLTSLKIDCTQNDAPQFEGAIPWYYFPALKNTIDNQQYHIELRDGALVDWTDDVKPVADPAVSPQTNPPTLKAVPDRLARNPRIHRV